MEEEFAAKALPLDLGDEFGEPIIVERKIRISEDPLIKRKIGSIVCCWKIGSMVCFWREVMAQSASILGVHVQRWARTFDY